MPNANIASTLCLTSPVKLHAQHIHDIDQVSQSRFRLKGTDAGKRAMQVVEHWFCPHNTYQHNLRNTEARRMWNAQTQKHCTVYTLLKVNH